MVVEQLNPTEKKSKSISSQCLKILKNSHFIKSTIEYTIAMFGTTIQWDIFGDFQPLCPTY